MGLYRDYIRRMESKMETTIVYFESEGNGFCHWKLEGGLSVAGPKDHSFGFHGFENVSGLKLRVAWNVGGLITAANEISVPCLSLVIVCANRVQGLSRS